MFFLSQINTGTLSDFCFLFQEIDPSILEAILAKREKKEKKPKKLTPEQADAKRRKMWISLAKKEIPRVRQHRRPKYNVIIFIILKENDLLSS